MIKKEDIQHIASLARISLTDEEVASLGKDLQDILSYIAKLEKLDTSAIEPTSHVLELKNVHREDNPRPSLAQSQALNIAVEKKDGFFKVPKVIE